MFYLTTQELQDIAKSVGRAREAYKRELCKHYGEDATRMFPIDITIRVMVFQDIPDDPRTEIPVEVLHFLSKGKGNVSR